MTRSIGPTESQAGQPPAAVRRHAGRSIRHDKIFYLVNYEGQVRNEPLTVNNNPALIGLPPDFFANNPGIAAQVNAASVLSLAASIRMWPSEDHCDLERQEHSERNLQLPAIPQPAWILQHAHIHGGRAFVDRRRHQPILPASLQTAINSSTRTNSAFTMATTITSTCHPLLPPVPRWSFKTPTAGSCLAAIASSWPQPIAASNSRTISPKC